MPWGKKARKTEEDKTTENQTKDEVKVEGAEGEKAPESDKPEKPARKAKAPKEPKEPKEPKAPKEKKEKKDPADPNAPAEEPKPKAKRGKKAEPPPEEPIVVETSIEDIEKFILEHSGSADLSDLLKDLLKNSTAPRKLINAAVGSIFQVIESDPGKFEWGRSLIHSLSTDHMEPKKRLREAHFFPNPNSEKNLIKHLLSATKTLIICVFALTNDNMANAIRQCKAKGVDIRLIFDDEMMRQPGSDVRALHDEGYPVRVDLDPKAHMHNKFVVIDDKVVITGSYNWTKQASTKNHENIVIFEDTEIADMYTKEFNRLWDEFASSVDQHLGGEKKEDSKPAEVPVPASQAN